MNNPLARADRIIDIALARRRQIAQRYNAAPPFSETSKDDEIARLRAIRRRHGPPFRPTVVTVLLVAVVLAVGHQAGSYWPVMVNPGISAAGRMLYTDSETGVRANSLDGSPSNAGVAVAMRDADMTLERVERWEFGNEWCFFEVFSNPDRSSYTTNRPDIEGQAAGSSIDSLVSTYGEEYSLMIENGGAIAAGEFNMEINGRLIHFNKWFISVPGKPAASIWLGSALGRVSGGDVGIGR